MSTPRGRDQAHRGFAATTASALAMVLVSATTWIAADVVMRPQAVAAVDTCTPDAGLNNCQRFSYSGGDQDFVVPKGVTSVGVKLWGAAGGSSTVGQWSGAAGGYTTGTVAVEPGAELQVSVGGGGRANAAGGPPGAYGGGGVVRNEVESQFGSAGGGGLSGLWSGPAFEAGNALLIAGGGGGGAANRAGGAVTAAGGGGALTGGYGGGASGGAGTQSAGGGVTTGNGCPVPATAGSQFQGGDGAAAGRPVNDGLGGESGGGGGGGWFGGGGGRCRPAVNAQPPGGGGGGSGYVGGPGVTAAATQGGDTSNGQNNQFRFPYGTEQAQYVSGAGASALAADGGPGLAVLQFFLPATAITAPATSTTDRTPAVNGRGSPGTTVTVVDVGTGETFCTTTVDDGGAWTCSPTTAAGYGTTSLRATENDPAAPRAAYPPSPAVNVTVVPAAVQIARPVEGSTTFELRPTISGTGADAGALVTVTVAGQTLTATADEQGAWTVRPGIDLPVGDHTATARQTVDGVESETTSTTFTIETLPSPTITAPAQGASLTNRRPTITGTAEPGATVTITVGGRTLTARADRTGRWQTSTALLVGAQTITATQTVASVTSATSPPRTFTIVAPPPAEDPPATTNDPDGSDSGDTSSSDDTDTSTDRAAGTTQAEEPEPPVDESPPADEDPPADDESKSDAAEPDQGPAPAGPAPEDPNSYLPVQLNFAAAAITPGRVASFVGTLGPNAATTPVTITLSGTMNRGMLYRSVNSNPAGTCVVTTLSFSCTITLQPGQQAVLQVRVLADALNSPAYARQQLTVSVPGGAQPNTVTSTTRIDKPTEVSQLAAAISGGPGTFLVLLLMYMFALAATEYERQHPRT